MLCDEDYLREFFEDTRIKLEKIYEKKHSIAAQNEQDFQTVLL